MDQNRSHQSFHDEHPGFLNHHDLYLSMLTCGRYGNPLSIASASVEDQKKMVQLLLKKRANVNAEGGLFGYALLAGAIIARKRGQRQY